MKLGLLLYGDLTMVSGGFLYDRLLVDFLRKKGDEVEVIPLDWGNYGACLLDNLSPRLWTRLAGGGFDVLLQDELIHPSCFRLNYRVRARAGFPVVSIVHHLRCFEKRADWQNRGYRKVESLYLNSVDGFIFNSLTTREAVRPMLTHRVPHVVAFPAADHIGSRITDEEISARALEPDRPLEILFVGSVTPRKQLHMLLDALALVNGAWRLTVVGSLSTDAPYASTLSKKIGLSGMDGQISLLGSVTADELTSIMKGSHVLAVPSSYEGFGIAYLEGMAFGLPALGTTSGGAREIITDGHDGFLVPPDDRWALALRIQGLVDDRTALASMSLNARRSYLARPGWSQSFEKVHEFLHGVDLKRR